METMRLQLARGLKLLVGLARRGAPCGKSLDHIGGVRVLPVAFGNGSEQSRSRSMQVFGPPLLPGQFPLTEGLFSLGAIGRAVDGRSLRHATVFPRAALSAILHSL